MADDSVGRAENVCNREVTIVPHQRLGGPSAWLVSCLCGFLVTDLGTRDAAEDTRLFHLGLPSLLGADS